jgi:hypothetical protein
MSPLILNLHTSYEGMSARQKRVSKIGDALHDFGVHAKVAVKNLCLTPKVLKAKLTQRVAPAWHSPTNTADEIRDVVAGAREDAARKAAKAAVKKGKADEAAKDAKAAKARAREAVAWELDPSKASEANECESDDPTEFELATRKIETDSNIRENETLAQAQDGDFELAKAKRAAQAKARMDKPRMDKAPSDNRLFADTARSELDEPELKNESPSEERRFIEPSKKSMTGLRFDRAVPELGIIADPLSRQARYYKKIDTTKPIEPTTAYFSAKKVKDRQVRLTNLEENPSWKGKEAKKAEQANAELARVARSKLSCASLELPAITMSDMSETD